MKKNYNQYLEWYEFEFCFNRGASASTYGDWDEAIYCYSEAIKKWKKSDGKENLAAAYNNRGLAYDNKGLYDEAIKDYNKL